MQSVYEKKILKKYLIIGSSSYLFNQNKEFFNNSIKLSSSDKRRNYLDKKILSHYLKKYEFEFIYIFIGKKFKQKIKNKIINYGLILKILKMIIKNSSQISKVVLFGSQNEFLNRKNNYYGFYKKKLKNYIDKNFKKKIEYIWLLLPLVYGKKLSRNLFVGDIIYNLKHSKPIKILNPENNEYLIYAPHLKEKFNFIENNWFKLKNKKIYPECDDKKKVKQIVKMLKNKINKKSKLEFKMSNNKKQPNIKNFKLKKKNRFSFKSFIKKFL